MLATKQVVSRHILHFLSKLYENCTLYEQCSHISLRLWSLMYSILLYWTDPKDLLAKECCRAGISARKSTTEHARAAKGVFATRNFNTMMS